MRHFYNSTTMKFCCSLLRLALRTSSRLCLRSTPLSSPSQIILTLLHLICPATVRDHTLVYKEKDTWPFSRLLQQNCASILCSPFCTCTHQLLTTMSAPRCDSQLPGAWSAHVVVLRQGSATYSSLASTALPHQPAIDTCPCDYVRIVVPLGALPHLVAGHTLLVNIPGMAPFPLDQHSVVCFADALASRVSYGGGPTPLTGRTASHSVQVVIFTTLRPAWMSNGVCHPPDTLTDGRKHLSSYISSNVNLPPMPWQFLVPQCWELKLSRADAVLPGVINLQFVVLVCLGYI